MIVTNDLEVRVGARTLLDAPGEHLRVQPGDRIGLVGRNGAGKTTTMRILAGEGEPYGGSIVRSGDIGYLPQDSREGNIEQTARDRVLSARGLDSMRRNMDRQQEIMETSLSDGKRDAAIRKYSRLEERYRDLGGYEADSEAARICDSLGLPARILDQPLKTLSGGQRRRVELAQILFAASAGAGKSATTLLLDEPTNHLDDRGRQLVIDTINNHPGVVVVATHDRDFLDAVCTIIGDLVPGREGIGMFRGNYTDYDKHRRHERQLWEHQWRTEQHEKARLEKTIETVQEEAGPVRAKRDNEKMGYDHSAGRADRQVARRIRSARQRLEQLEEDGVGKPPALLGFDAPLTKPLSTKRAPAGSEEDFHVKMRGVVVPDRIFVGSLTIRPGDTLVVTGPNGAGKSTLLKVILGQIPTASGELRLSPETRVEMLAQEQDWEDPTLSPAEMYDLTPSPTVTLNDLGLLTARDTKRPVGDLSVGQQRRVALALIVADPPDILLLDEPTNHLSVDLIEEVQDAISAAEGTVIVVTHDRRMVDFLEARHLVVEEGQVTELPRGKKPVEFA